MRISQFVLCKELEVLGNITDMSIAATYVEILSPNSFLRAKRQALLYIPAGLANLTK